MAEETPAQLRLSRALAHDDGRYKRALSTAKKLSKHELAKAAAHLLMQLMRERAFANRIDEVRATHHERWTVELRAERDAFRAASATAREHRAKGGNTRAAPYNAKREEARAAYASSLKHRHRTKSSFATAHAGEYGVTPRTVERWLK